MHDQEIRRDKEIALKRKNGREDKETKDKIRHIRDKSYSTVKFK
jgi:hypothetical protein